MNEYSNSRTVQVSTPLVEAWARHITGVERLTPRPGIRDLGEAVELNRGADTIISTFGNRIFSAAVGFIDLRGFSSLAHGKSPQEIANHAQRYLSLVIDLAGRHHAFIDKTIGDEVMLVIPYFANDAQMAIRECPDRSLLIIEPSVLMADLLKTTGVAAIAAEVVATFSVGSLTLAQVGDDNFSEWTCFGEAIHVAKRLQDTKPDTSQPDAVSQHWFALGAADPQDGSEPRWPNEIKEFARLTDSIGGMNLSDRTVQKAEFKGVGIVTYIAGIPSLYVQRT